jgi:hypothetical protein
MVQHGSRGHIHERIEGMKKDSKVMDQFSMFPGRSLRQKPDNQMHGACTHQEQTKSCACMCSLAHHMWSQAILPPLHSTTHQQLRRIQD